MQKNISIRRNAQKLAKAGQLAKAIETYLPILESDADPYDHLYVGDLCVKAGRVQEAVQRYESAIEEYRRLGFHRNAVALCRKILRLDPGHYDIHRRLGQLFAADELIGDALQSYQRYFGCVPADNRSNKVFSQAISHACELALRKTTLALRLSETLVQVDRADDAAEVLLRSAEVSHCDGDGELAAELLAKAAQIDPGVTERVGQMTEAMNAEGEVASPVETMAAGASGIDESAVVDINTSLEELVLSSSPKPLDNSTDAPRGDPLHENDSGEDILEDVIGVGVDRDRGAPSTDLDYGAIDLDGAQEDDLLPSSEEMSSPGLLDDLMGTADAIGAEPDRPVEAPAGRLADPIAATRVAMEAEQWTAAAKRVEEWLQIDSQSTEAAEKLVEISEALQDNAGVVRGLILQGDALIQAEELAEAVPYFARILALDPENETAKRRMLRFAELGLEGAQVVVAACAPVDASTETEEAITSAEAVDEIAQPGIVRDVLASRDAVVDVRGSGAVDEESGDHQEWLEIGALLEEFQEGIKQQVGDDDPQANYDLGVSHMEMELFEEALEQFEFALSGSDCTPAFLRRLHELRGNCQRSLERHHEAIHEYRLGLEVEGSTAGERNGLRFLLAQEFEAVGDLNAAKEILRELLSEQSGFGEAAELLHRLENSAA